MGVTCAWRGDGGHCTTAGLPPPQRWCQAALAPAPAGPVLAVPALTLLAPCHCHCRSATASLPPRCSWWRALTLHLHLHLSPSPSLRLRLSVQHCPHARARPCRSLRACSSSLRTGCTLTQTAPSTARWASGGGRARSTVCVGGGGRSGGRGWGGGRARAGQPVVWSRVTSPMPCKRAAPAPAVAHVCTACTRTLTGAASASAAVHKRTMAHARGMPMPMPHLMHTGAPRESIHPPITTIFHTAAALATAWPSPPTPSCCPC